jgi:Ca2+-binding RTX toxin-like protein
MTVKIGNRGNNELDGTNGHDRLLGRGGNDELDGRGDRDKLFGNSGHDELSGDSGNDRLYGNGGNDDLDGGSGEDKLWGGNGRDELDGDNGNDVLVGGKSADRFIFDENAGRDLIKDFQVGVDRIQIDIDAINGFGKLTITDNAKGYAIIELGSGDSITLKGVSKASLSASDFMFDS